MPIFPNRKSLALLFSLGLGVVGAGLGACNGGEIGGEGSGDQSGGGDGDGGGGGVSDMGGFNRDAACAAVRAEATLAKKPVDIIFVVDNSGSMTQEIQGVERNINQNFADIISKSGLDYRVILIGKHGTASADQSICITKPLSGNTTCSPPPAKPTNGPRFFQYDTEVASTNSLSLILSTYNTKDANNFTTAGWSEWLRPDAVRVFIEITDDNSALSATSFDTQLLAKTPKNFGTAAARNYIFHTIAGLKENNPATAPWKPTDPIQANKCTNGTGAVNNGQVYQELSRLTGGLRFPICEYASFDAVFQNVAAGVVAGSKVACEFDIPKPPEGQQVDLSTVLVEYTPGAGGPAKQFTKVASAAQCAAGSFYIESGRIKLCPDTCSTVQADTMAKMQVLFDCVVMIN